MRPAALALLLAACAACVPGGAGGGPAAAAPFEQPMKDGRFVNLDGWSSPSFGSALKWAVGDKLTGKRRSGPEGAPAPRVEPDLARLATPPRIGEPARLTWLGHASWLVQLDGESLLVDPVLRDSIPGFIRRKQPPGLRVGELPKIAACLVSHSHYDHLDRPTLAAVHAPVIAGKGVGAVVADDGLGAVELGWWESVRVGPVKVTFVPSQHWSRRGLFDTNETLWGGFVIEGSTATLYHSGDTAFFGGFEEIGRRFHVDAAMLPIGAYDPEWFMGRQHMNPEQAVQAFVDLGAGTFLAMHWGTFKLTDEPLDEPPQRFRAEWRRRGLPEARGKVLAIGETVEVGTSAHISPSKP